MDAMDVDNWSNKYRPRTTKQMIGQPTAVALVDRMLTERRIARTILISGETGHGKTTLARIIAEAVNDGRPWKTNTDVLDVNAGAEGGIDKIRGIADVAANMPQFGNFRVFMIDEAHKLTGAARNASLKLTEEPPGRSMFILLTNYPDELPTELLGRCLHIRLKAVEPKALMPYLASIGKAENAFQPPQANAAIYRWCAESAGGQPRQAVQLFQMCAMLEGRATPDQIMAEVIATYGEPPEKSAVQLMCGMYSFTPKIVVQALQGVQDPPAVIRQALYLSQSMVEKITECQAKWTSVHFRKLEDWLARNSNSVLSLEYVLAVHGTLAKLLDHSGYSTAAKNATIIAGLGMQMETYRNKEVPF